MVMNTELDDLKDLTLSDLRQQVREDASMIMRSGGMILKTGR